MTRFLLIIFGVLAVCFVPFGTLWGVPITEEPPLKPVAKENIVESKKYKACFGNFGTLRPTLNLAGETIRDKKTGDSQLPDFALSSNIAFQFGCQYGKWIVDYTISDDSFLFQKEVLIDNTLYNGIFLHQEIISFGYALPVIEEVLLGEFGLSYSQFRYELGYYAGNSSSDKTDPEQYANLFLAQITLLYIFSNTHTIRWRYQKSLDDSDIIDSNNQFSLNFLVPF